MARIKSKRFIFYFSFIFVIALYLVFVTMTKTYVGIDVSENDEGSLIVTKVDSIGWAAQRKIKVGDRVIEVNHQEADTYHSIQNYGVIGNLNQMKVMREGTELEYKVQNPMNYNTLLYHTILPTVVFFVLFLFALQVYIKKRRDPIAFYLIAFLLAVGIGYLSAGASARTDSLARVINSFSLMMVPVLFLHFHYQYFLKYEIHLIEKRILAAVYSINLIVVLMDVISVFWISLGNYEVIRNTQLILFSMEILFGLSVLLYFYMTFRKTIHKSIFQNAIFGIIVSFFPFIFLTALPNAVVGVELIPAPVTAVFLIFLPIFFLYLVLTDRIFDIDFINSRLRYYAVISFILTAVVMILLVFFTNLDELQWIRLGILIYGLLILFFYFEEKFSLRSKLFGDKFNYQLSLDRFSYDIAKIIKKEELDDRLLREIKEVLPVEHACLFSYNKKENGINLIAGDESIPYPLIQACISYQGKSLSIGMPFLSEDGLGYVLSEKYDSVDILWIEQKVNRTPFNQDEQRWLKTIVQYTSIVYENFQLIEGVAEDLKSSIQEERGVPSWMLRFMFKLSEEERARLSADLHDSALQEQLVWYRKVEELTASNDLDSRLKEELTEVREGLLDVVSQIRETCTFLRPPFLKETGFIEALSYLIDHYRLREDFRIDYQYDQFTADLGDEQALTLYRIAQELLNNASKHSKAELIEFELKNDGDMVMLSYKDDGVGVPNNQQKSSTKSMGLTGIRQRVNSLGGSMEFFSQEGSGVEAAILIQAEG